jgi:hypothetical protein
MFSSRASLRGPESPHKQSNWYSANFEALTAFGLPSDRFSLKSVKIGDDSVIHATSNYNISLALSVSGPTRVRITQIDLQENSPLDSKQTTLSGPSGDNTHILLLQDVPDNMGASPNPQPKQKSKPQKHPHNKELMIRGGVKPSLVTSDIVTIGDATLNTLASSDDTTCTSRHVLQITTVDLTERRQTTSTGRETNNQQDKSAKGGSTCTERGIPIREPIASATPQR